MVDEANDAKLKALRSFQIKSVADMISKLDWEIGMLVDMQNGIEPEAVRSASYYAINAAITAWHVVDWLWGVASDDLRADWLKESAERACRKPKVRFQLHMTALCPALRLCKEVANASKHLEADRFTDHSVRTSGPVFVTVHGGAGSLRAGDPIATHTAWLLIRDGAEQHTARTVLDEANDFLWGFAAEHGLLSLPESE